MRIKKNKRVLLPIQCKGCSRWFIPARITQECCSSKCKITAYEKEAYRKNLLAEIKYAERRLVKKEIKTQMIQRLEELWCEYKRGEISKKKEAKLLNEIEIIELAITDSNLFGEEAECISQIKREFNKLAVVLDNIDRDIDKIDTRVHMLCMEVSGITDKLRQQILKLRDDITMRLCEVKEKIWRGYSYDITTQRSSENKTGDELPLSLPGSEPSFVNQD